MDKVNSRNDYLGMQTVGKNKRGDLALISPNGDFRQPYYQTKSSLMDIDLFVKFIKSCEKLIRMHPDYSTYVGYAKNELGLNRCAIQGNVTCEDAPLEMHHGPIFTLFDYCAVMTDAMLRRGEKVNTFIITEKILEEHYNNNIQFVMLTETNHQLVHTDNMFISLKHAFGDLSKFIEKYREGISPAQVDVINNYIETSKKYDTDFTNYLGNINVETKIQSFNCGGNYYDKYNDFDEEYDE